MASIDLGWTVWSAVRSFGGRDPLTGDLIDPHGGVVVEVRWPDPDLEDEPLPTYVCLNPHPFSRLEFRTVPADEVGLLVEPPDPATISWLIRRIAGTIGYDDRNRHRLKARTGDLNEHEVDLVSYLGRLTAVVASLRPPKRFVPSLEDELATMAPAPGSVFVD